MDSILLSVKESLGIPLEEVVFDGPLMIAINTAFMSLMQLGVGVSTGFRITSPEDVWEDFLAGATDLEGAKSLIVLKTKLFFDPPNTSFLVEAYERQINELEFRLMAQEEPPVV